MEDEAVLDLESEFEDDAEHSEDERLLSSLRQSLGPGTDGAFRESDDDSDLGRGSNKRVKGEEGEDTDTRWGSSKAAYYNGEESSEDDQGGSPFVWACSKSSDSLF